MKTIRLKAWEQVDGKTCLTAEARDAAGIRTPVVCHSYKMKGSDGIELEVIRVRPRLSDPQSDIVIIPPEAPAWAEPAITSYLTEATQTMNQ